MCVQDRTRIKQGLSLVNAKPLGSSLATSSSNPDLPLMESDGADCTLTMNRYGLSDQALATAPISWEGVDIT